MARIGSWLRVMLGALAVVCTSTTGLAKPAASPHKVLLVVREGADSHQRDLMIPKELVVMIDTLKAAGLKPVVASLSGDAFVSQTATVRPDLKLKNVKVSDYVAVVLPCLSAGEPGNISDLEAKITKEAAAGGKPIAAQRSGLYILSKAGLLKGRQYAYHGVAPFPEGTHSEDPVVQDGTIITAAICPNAARGSGLPDTTVPLIKKLIEALG
jgi:putative intracellular protease/amidase